MNAKMIYCLSNKFLAEMVIVSNKAHTILFGCRMNSFVRVGNEQRNRNHPNEYSTRIGIFDMAHTHTHNFISGRMHENMSKLVKFDKR